VERHKAQYWVHQVTGTTDRIAWHGHVRDVVIQSGHVYVLDGLEMFEVNLRDGSLAPFAPIPAHVQGITISPDGVRIAGFVFGRFDTARSPSRVVTVRISDGAVKDFELRDYAYGDVVWVNDRTIAYLPGGSDDQHVWLLNAATMRSVGGFDGCMRRTPSSWVERRSVSGGDSSHGQGSMTVMCVWSARSTVRRRSSWMSSAAAPPDRPDQRLTRRTGNATVV
jgi:hypothetical protein